MFLRAKRPIRRSARQGLIAIVRAALVFSAIFLYLPRIRCIFLYTCRTRLLCPIPEGYRASSMPIRNILQPYDFHSTSTCTFLISTQSLDNPPAQFARKGTGACRMGSQNSAKLGRARLGGRRRAKTVQTEPTVRPELRRASNVPLGTPARRPESSPNVHPALSPPLDRRHVRPVPLAFTHHPPVPHRAPPAPQASPVRPPAPKPNVPSGLFHTQALRLVPTAPMGPTHLRQARRRA